MIEHRVVRPTATSRTCGPSPSRSSSTTRWSGSGGRPRTSATSSRVEAALNAEQARRETAELLAELASHLNQAASAQDIVEAVHEATKEFWDLAAVVLGRVEPEEPVLRLSYADTGLPDSIQARYLRTPLTVDTHMTRAVNQARPLWLGDRGAATPRIPDTRARRRGDGRARASRCSPLTACVGRGVRSVWVWRGRDPVSSSPRQRPAARASPSSSRARPSGSSFASWNAPSPRRCSSGCSRSTFGARRRSSAPATGPPTRPWRSAATGTTRCSSTTAGSRSRSATSSGAGLPAATTMGQLRAALGVTAMQADDAADAIRILDRYADRISGSQVRDGRVRDHRSRRRDGLVCERRASTAAAGAARRHDAVPRRRCARGPCASPRRSREPAAATEPMPAGSLLLLYTDGLVERKGESLDVGLARLEAGRRRELEPAAPAPQASHLPRADRRPAPTPHRRRRAGRRRGPPAPAPRSSSTRSRRDPTRRPRRAGTGCGAGSNRSASTANQRDAIAHRGR